MKRAIGVVVLCVAVAIGAGSAIGDNTAVSDKRADTKRLKKNPQLDIVRATAGHGVGGKLKHKVTMAGKLKPGRKNTRPFILINTKGGKRSDFEYLVLGPRVFRATNDGFEKVGANRFSARKRTWVYRFKAEKIGVKRSYDWAALTAKGRAIDLAPNRRYREHDLRR